MKTFLLVEQSDKTFSVGRVTGLGTVEVVKYLGPYKKADEALNVIRSLNYTAEVERGERDIYSACPACSGERAVSTSRARGSRGDQVFDCVSCAAVFGRIAEVADYVAFPLTSGEAKYYFDFTTPKGRVHGWTNESGRVVQLG